MADKTSVWQFSNPVNLIFGVGSLSKLPELVSWDSVLLVTTPGATMRGTTQRVQDLLGSRISTTYDKVGPEPQLAVLENAGHLLRGYNYNGIVAVGGGSAIDTAKVLSYLLKIKEPQLRAHFEQFESLSPGETLPILAVPTTAGTGSEVTPFATVWDHDSRKKYSFAMNSLHPHIALLDPELTLSATRNLTLSCGLDALCQGLESLWSRNTNPVTTNLALQAVSIALHSLPLAVEDLESLELRTQMLEASLLAGLAISVTKTTLPHSISYPLTLKFGVPHGLACAFTIIQVLRFNAIGNKDRITNIAQKLGFPSVELLASKLDGILRGTGALSWLSQLMTSKQDCLALAPQAISPGRSDNNPRIPSVRDVEAILDSAWMYAHTDS
jgi:phosphonate metabolism-associated iron-containing alcohol dehydrogenase